MDESKRPSLTAIISAVASAAAILISIGTMIWNGAVITAAVNENRRRIEMLEVSGRNTTDAIARIDARTARIEGKLEIILPTSTVQKIEAQR